MSFLTCTRKSRIFEFGDSTNVGLGGGVVPFYTGMELALAAKFGLQLPAAGYASTIVGQQAPIFYVDAAAGRKFGDISPTIATLINEVPQPTDIVFWLGINDAAAIAALTLDIPTMQGQVNACLTAALTRVTGSHIGIVGPWAHDSGDLAPQIALIDTNIPPLVQAIGGQYFQLSQLSNGGGNTVSDGTHPTFQGETAGANLIVAQIVVLH